MVKIEFTEEQRKLVFYIIDKELNKINKSKINDKYCEELIKILEKLTKNQKVFI